MVKYRWKNSMKEQILVFGIIMTIFLMTFFRLSNEISKRILVNHSSRTGEQILLQIKEYIDNFNKDMENILTNLSYSPTIVQYFKSDASQRAVYQNNVMIVLGNIRILRDNIQGICLYSREGILLAEYGDYIEHEWQSQPGEDATLQYSNLYVQKNGIKFCTVAMPVYDIKSRFCQKQIGTCVILLDLAEFEDILDQMQITDNSEMIITDGENQVVAYTGKKKTVPEVYGFEAIRGNDDYIVNEMTVEGMGWKIASIIPRKDIKERFNQLQIINIVTCFGVVLLEWFFGIVCYRSICLPIKRLASFVREHLEYPEDRIKLKAVSEIEILAENLNRMLDEQDNINRKVQEMQKAVYQAEILQKQAELLAYQSQIEPHFLYNILDCIQSMAYEYGAEPVGRIVLELSKMFRYSTTGEGMVLLRQELEYIRQYAAIIECRFMGRITVEIEAEDEVLNVQMPKFLLQPLVENAIFHGLERCSRKGSVMVRATAERTAIRIEVTDNGCGMSSTKLCELNKRLEHSQEMEQKQKGTGVGLVNIYQRLKLVYGEDAIFRIESRLDKGTQIILKLPGKWKGKSNV